MSHLKYFNYPEFGTHALSTTHYSQAAIIPAGRTLLISGQGGISRQAPFAVFSDLGDEIDAAFANVEAALQFAGGKGWSQVYKVHGYLAGWTKVKEGEMEEHLIRNLRKYCPDHAPLLTVVGVEKLAFEGMRIEIEVQAHLGD